MSKSYILLAKVRKLWAFLGRTLVLVLYLNLSCTVRYSSQRAPNPTKQVLFQDAEIFRLYFILDIFQRRYDMNGRSQMQGDKS